MNKQLTTSLIIAGLISSVSGVSYAQQNNAPTINAPAQVTQGNAFEREMTPLLREISRKKSQLELRKLDRDLEKLDEESLKAQMGMESTLNGGQAKGGYDPFATQKAASAMPNGMPAGLPAAQMMQPTANGIGTATNPIEGASDIKVLMIYGFDDKLYAKVASGDQGGYAVKKGDVLPNGQVVSSVTANYIEVRKNAGKSKGPIQRIFVSQSVGTVTLDSSSRQMGGSASSARLLPPGAAANEAAAAALLAPQASPGARR
jgi:hypothetical protein